MEASAFRRNVGIALWHETADNAVIASNIIHLPLVAIHDMAGVIALRSGIGGYHHQ